MENKILVYDCSLFGQALGRFLERELGVEVERIVDLAKINEMSDREICQHVAKKIKPFIGKVAGVVIASPLVVSVVASELEKIFPEQEFVYLGKNMAEGIKGSNRIAVLTPPRIRRTERYQVRKAAFQEAEVEELNCKEWLNLMDKGWWGEKKIENCFRHKLGMKVVIYHQAMLLREKEVEEIVDWRGELVDGREEMLLSLRGVIKRNKRKQEQKARRALRALKEMKKK